MEYAIRRLAVGFSCLLWLAAATGCRALQAFVLILSTDGVRHDVPYNTDYVTGAPYRLREPVFVVKHEGPRSTSESYFPRLYLCRVSTQDATPSDEAQYKNDGPGKWPHIVAFLPKGTILRCKECRIVDNVEMGRRSSVLVTVEGFSKLGAIVADGISKVEGSGDPPSFLIDHQYLEPVNATDKRGF